MTNFDLGSPHLSLIRHGCIGVCTIDRPESRNALTSAMYRGIGRAVRIVTADPELEAMVLTGTDDVFVPGGDMKEELEEVGVFPAPSEIVPFALFRNSTIPLVAAVNGICQASGLMFALLSDIAVASDRATFRAPQLLRGFSDTWLAAVLPAHVGMGRAREMALTARRFDAQEAWQLGIVSSVVPHDELLDSAFRYANSILETAPRARQQWKREASSRYGLIDEITLDLANESSEVEEGFHAFLEKRPPAWSPRSRTHES